MVAAHHAGWGPDVLRNPVGAVDPALRRRRAAASTAGPVGGEADHRPHAVRGVPELADRSGRPRAPDPGVPCLAALAGRLAGRCADRPPSAGHPPTGGRAPPACAPAVATARGTAARRARPDALESPSLRGAAAD